MPDRVFSAEEIARVEGLVAAYASMALGQSVGCVIQLAEHDDLSVELVMSRARVCGFPRRCRRAIGMARHHTLTQAAMQLAWRAVEELHFQTVLEEPHAAR